MTPPSSTAKFATLITALLISTGAIVLRLAHLQIGRGHDLLATSQKNCSRLEKVVSPRGAIIDIHGNLLATNRPTLSLYWHGTGNKKLSDDQHTALEKINAIFQLDPEIQTDLLRAERLGNDLLLAYDITFEQLSQYEEQLSKYPNIKLVKGFQRFYPHHEFACHLIGYLGHVDYEPTGKMGLEKILEARLKGEYGHILRIINSLGKNIEERALKEAMAGEDIQTTIDLRLQQIAEQTFGNTYAGCMIIMDPKTGALRALVSRPAFDPNMFLATIERETWQNLEKQHAFLNRAFNACYPPASLFKLITASAALEHNIINEETIVFCRGQYLFGPQRYWCHKHEGHGTLTAKQAVAQSCNILFYHIGKHIHIDTLADYACRFGLGQKTNSIFPENEGLIPSSVWKRATKNERWWPGETLSAAIGQSYLLVTPIQIARMISAIFQGYLVTPRILDIEPIETKPLGISKKTLSFLRESMRSVVTMGTGINLSHLKNFIIHAKTGTAQTSSLSLREQDDAFAEHAWFVMHFKYKDHSPLTMVIMVEHAGSSSVATAIGKKFLITYQDSVLDRAELCPAPGRV